MGTGWQYRHYINLHKGTILPYSFLLFRLGGLDPLEDWTASLYLALHGGYGVLWLLKDTYFGDAQWATPLPFYRGLVDTLTGLVLPSRRSGLSVLLGLQLYTAAPIIIARNHPVCTPGLGCVAVTVWGLGLFMHFSSDAQKFFVLKARKERRLITDGFFKFTRNPNYFGELLTYASFAMLSQHWLPFLTLATFVGVVFVPNILQMDRRMSRHADWAAWKAETGLCFPSWRFLLDLPGSFVPWAGSSGGGGTAELRGDPEGEETQVFRRPPRRSPRHRSRSRQGRQGPAPGSK